MSKNPGGYEPGSWGMFLEPGAHSHVTEHVSSLEQLVKIADYLRDHPRRHISGTVRWSLVGSAPQRKDFWIDIVGTNWVIVWNDLSYKSPSWEIRNARDIDNDAEIASDDPEQLHAWLNDCLHAGGMLLKSSQKRSNVEVFLNSMEAERRQIVKDLEERGPRFWKYCVVMYYVKPKSVDLNYTVPTGPDDHLPFSFHYFDADNHFEAGKVFRETVKRYDWNTAACWICDENRLVRQLTKDEIETPPAPPAPTDAQRQTALDEIKEAITSGELLTIASIKEIMKRHGV